MKKARETSHPRRRGRQRSRRACTTHRTRSALTHENAARGATGALRWTTETERTETAHLMATTGTFGFRTDLEGGIKVEGLSAVQRDLRKLGGDLDLNKSEFLATNKKVAEVVIGGSKRFVPVLSGALAETIRNASTKKSAKIRVGDKTGVPYAGPIHFGWPKRRIMPQPFIYEAIDGRRAEVAMIYAERLTEIRNRYDL